MSKNIYKIINEVNYNFNSNEFYVYELKHNSEPFYVGKGRDNRAWKHAYRRKSPKLLKSNPHFYRKLQKIIDDLKEPVYCHIVFSGSEQECFNKERELIQRYRKRKDGGTLTNISDGGEGYTQEGRSVDQYTKWGEYVATYKNAKEAMRLNGWNSYSCIGSCCKGRDVSYKGFLWCYKGEQPKMLKKRRPVYQYTFDGEFVNVYDNVSEAARVMYCDPSTINDCVHGHIRQAVGYLWTRDKDYIPTLRASKLTKKVKHINTGRIFSSVTEASTTFGHNVGTVSKCCKGKKDSVGGNKFCYVEG